MRCLYCGKELALLKRLRGGGDFCSDAHKQSYQDEYDRLALNRLLQAQKKGQTVSSPAQGAVLPPSVSVALEEPVPDDTGRNATDPAAEVQVLEVALREALAPAVPPASIDSAAAEESPAHQPPHARGLSKLPLGAEPEPANSAGFLFESPALASLAGQTPYLEPWMELSPGPAMSEWQIQNGALSLSCAERLSLDLPPKVSSIENTVCAADLSPQAFAAAQPKLAVLPVGNAKKIAKADRFPAGSAIAIDIEPSRVAPDADRILMQALRWESSALYGDSRLLELSPTGIDFPAQDSAVVVVAGAPYPLAEAPYDASLNSGLEKSAGDDRPRASLEALSRLHRELVEQEAADAPQGNDTVEIAAEDLRSKAEAPEPQAGASKQRPTVELFEISIKTFPPAKAALLEGHALPSRIAPLLPRLKLLPLRPKVALATGYVPPSNAEAPSDLKPGLAEDAAVATPAPWKAVATGEPAARFTQPKQPAKPAQTVAAKNIEPRTPSGPQGESVQSDTTQPAAVAEPNAAGPNVTEVAPAPAVPFATGTPRVDQAPNFGIAQPTEASWHGSLKVKLGVAILLLVGACTYFLGWGGGKPGKLILNPAAAGDGSGPSIIIGEGGWVEGWAGDPSGLHAGRQITIYRPSLKLSDYRLEFKASMDSKSIGWVFRASDPNNYYAMKLMTVSSGLSPKVALFKYLVAAGRQTQVGRVPIELAVGLDTVFDVRVDVRGPQFTTYLQGQQVDSWTDDQLKTGGAGFLNEREESGKVKSVAIRYLKGAAK
jgi:hypothetical protein